MKQTGISSNTPFCLQESFNHEMTNMRASLDQINVQTQLPDIGN